MITGETATFDLVPASLTVISAVLIWPLLYKALQSVMVYCLVSWKNAKGERMKGEPPKLPFGHFNQVNFFGRPLSKKYGPVYYIWHCFTPIVMLSDAKAIRTFYSDHHSHERERNMTCLGSLFEEILGSSMVTSHGRDEIRRCRGPFEKYFSAQIVSSGLKVIERECTLFVNSLAVGKPVELDERTLGNVTLRILIHEIYGEEVLEKYFERFLEICAVLLDTLEMDNMGITRMPFYSYLPTKANRKANSFNRAWNGFNRFLFKEYEEGRLKSGESWFFSIVESIKTHQLELGEEELFQTLNEIALLNIDVSYAATSFVLTDLARHQAIQDRVRLEIDEFLNECDSNVGPDLNKKLPYLESVLKESARVHPPLSYSLPEKTVKPVTDLGGYLVPKGTSVCVDSFSLNFSDKYWKNPEQFNPERFADGAHQVPGSFFRFGMGPRKCLGYRYAEAINRVMVISVLRKYTLQLSDVRAQPRIKTQGFPGSIPYVCPDVIFKDR